MTLDAANSTNVSCEGSCRMCDSCNHQAGDEAVCRVFTENGGHLTKMPSRVSRASMYRMHSCPQRGTNRVRANCERAPIPMPWHA